MRIWLSIITVFGSLFLIIAISRLDDVRISAVILPHHDLVSQERSDLMERLATEVTPKTIILLSTNHYETGQSDIQVLDRDFETKNGSIPLAKNLMSTAINLDARIEGTTFIAEHGIKNILPDIAEYFPEVPVLAGVINKNVDKAKFQVFLSNIQKNCRNCLLIGSVDASHYQPYALSELHDRLTVRSLTTLNSELAYELAEVDSPIILSGLIEWAKQAGTESFKLIDHTNSTEISKDYYAEGTTHIMGWFEKGNRVKTEPEVSFSIVGDIMFDKWMANFENSYLGILDKFGDRVLWGTDLVFGNLEGPITNQKLIDKPDNLPSFAFSPLTVMVLDQLHLNTVSLANNHAFDAGQPGYDGTTKILATSGIDSLARDQLKIIEGHKLDLAVISVDLNRSQSEKVEDLIAKATQRKNTKVLIYAHWGADFSKVPSDLQIKQAHTWVDLGADLIIGTGTHTVQNLEVYNNVPIFYSLGNFISNYREFDEPQQSLILSGYFNEESLFIIPSLIETKTTQLVLQRNETADILTMGLLKINHNYIADRRGGILLQFNQ